MCFPLLVSETGVCLFRCAFPLTVADGDLPIALARSLAFGGNTSVCSMLEGFHYEFV